MATIPADRPTHGDWSFEPLLCMINNAFEDSCDFLNPKDTTNCPHKNTIYVGSGRTLAEVIGGDDTAVCFNKQSIFVENSGPHFAVNPPTENVWNEQDYERDSHSNCPGYHNHRVTISEYYDIEWYEPSGTWRYYKNLYYINTYYQIWYTVNRPDSIPGWEYEPIDGILIPIKCPPGTTWNPITETCETYDNGSGGGGNDNDGGGSSGDGSHLPPLDPPFPGDIDSFDCCDYMPKDFIRWADGWNMKQLIPPNQR